MKLVERGLIIFILGLISPFAVGANTALECREAVVRAMAEMTVAVKVPGNEGYGHQLRAQNHILAAQIEIAKKHNAQVAETGGAYVYPMLNIHTGEFCAECKLTIWKGVQYLAPEEAAPALVTIENGLIMSRGLPLHTIVTAEAPELSSWENEWDFVLTGDKKLYVTRGVPGKTHHSSLVAGGPVAAAGTIRVEHGVITKITSQSGHYQEDSGFFIAQFFDFLEKNRVRIPNRNRRSLKTSHIGPSYVNWVTSLNIPTSFLTDTRLLRWTHRDTIKAYEFLWMPRQYVVPHEPGKKIVLYRADLIGVEITGMRSAASQQGEWGAIEEARREVESENPARVQRLLEWHKSGSAASPFLVATFDPRAARVLTLGSRPYLSSAATTLYRIEIDPSRAILNVDSTGRASPAGEVLILGDVRPDDITVVKPTP